MAIPAKKEIVSAPVPTALVDEVRQIAARDGETQAAIIRRLLRAGLKAERESTIIGAV